MQSQRNILLKGPGWTPVPNYLLDTIYHFDPVQFKILMFVVRRLYGWENPRDEFSVRFLSSNTGIPRSTVQRHLRFMISSGIFQDLGRGKKGSRRLGLSPVRPGILDNSEIPGDIPPATEESTVQDRTVHSRYRLVGQEKKNKPGEIICTDPLSSLTEYLSPGSFRLLTGSYVGIQEDRILFSRPVPSYLAGLIQERLGYRVSFQQAV